MRILELVELEFNMVVLLITVISHCQLLGCKICFLTQFSVNLSTKAFPRLFIIGAIPSLKYQLKENTIFVVNYMYVCI